MAVAMETNPVFPFCENQWIPSTGSFIPLGSQLRPVTYCNALFSNSCKGILNLDRGKLVGVSSGNDGALNKQIQSHEAWKRKLSSQTSLFL